MEESWHWPHSCSEYLVRQHTEAESTKSCIEQVSACVTERPWKESAPQKGVVQNWTWVLWHPRTWIPHILGLESLLGCLYVYIFLTYICLMSSNRKMLAICLTQCWTHNCSSSIFHPFFCIHNLQIGLGHVVDICEFKSIICVSIGTSIHWDAATLFIG